MRPDPFDRLKEQNPMPADRLPPAPMSLADRITGRNTRRRAFPGWAMAAAVAVAVAAVGGAWLLFIGGDATHPATGASSPSGTAAASVESTTVPAEPPVTTEAPATSAAVETPGPSAVTTSMAAGSDTTVPPVGYGGEFPIYLLLGDNGTEASPGPHLIPTMRTTAVMSAPVTDLHGTVASFLMRGPTPPEAESVPAMSTAIPEGTEVLGVEVNDGIATIDLSSEFTSGGGTLSMTGRLAQVVYTLTAFDDVDGVRFEIEGAPTTIFGGEGIVIDDPATRAEFESLLPAVMIESPPNWGQAGNPLVVSGTANVFEATVSLTLADADGLILWEGSTTAGCGTGCRGDFQVEIPYDVDEAQMGSIVAWEASARDGSQTNVREHAVWLTPAAGSTDTTTTIADGDPLQRIRQLRGVVVGLTKDIAAADDRAASADDPDETQRYESIADTLRLEQAGLRDELSIAVDAALGRGLPYDLILDGTCSGALVATEAEIDPALDGPVLETWESLRQAAMTCDWVALAALAGDDLRFTFGMPGDAVEYWQHEEALGFEPMRYLAEFLNRPHGIVEPGDGSSIMVWPSAFAYDSWGAVPEMDREALRPLYGDAAFAEFAEFGGYFGYRIGIDAGTGRWQFFVVGD